MNNQCFSCWAAWWQCETDPSAAWSSCARHTSAPTARERIVTPLRSVLANDTQRLWWRTWRGACSVCVCNVRGGACAETDAFEEQLLIEQSKCYCRNYCTLTTQSLFPSSFRTFIPKWVIQKSLTMGTSKNNSPINLNYLNIYSPSGQPRCGWACLFIRTDLEKFSITSLAHQRILCSEWVPSEWASKQMIKTSQ